MQNGAHKVHTPFEDDINPFAEIIPSEVSVLILQHAFEQRCFLPAFRNTDSFFREITLGISLQKLRLEDADTEDCQKAQDEEINYILANKERIIQKNHLGREVVQYFERLALSEHTPSMDATRFLAREALLNHINEAIIRSCMGRFKEVLECRDRNLTRFPVSLLTCPELKSYWSKLTWVILSENNLTKVPPEIGNLSALTMLNLNYNRLTKMPNEIGRLQNLRSLCLEHNQLLEIPVTLGEMAALDTLDLSNNQLTSIPKSMIRLEKIHSLYLANNLLTDIPLDTFQMPVLSTLDISNNLLSSLPYQISQLSSLAFLNLASNELSSIPDAIGQMNALQMLMLSNNRLTDLPKNLPDKILFSESRIEITRLRLLQSQKGKLNANKKSRLRH